MTYGIYVKNQRYELWDGQKFYHNNYSTAKGHTLPDYLILERIQLIGHGNDKMYLLTCKYENHEVYTKERVLSDVILTQSNLNPNCKNPDWIFEVSSQNLQST